MTTSVEAAARVPPREQSRRFRMGLVRFVAGLVAVAAIAHGHPGGLTAAARADESQVAQRPARSRRATETVELRGVWVSDVDSQVMHSRANMATLAERIAALNMNALYPVVWSQGETFYPSDVMATYAGRAMAARYGLAAADRDPMSEWVALGEQHGLDIVPWFEWGLKVPADSPLAAKHPEWLSCDDSGQRTFDQDGTATSYLSFVHPDVQRFYEELMVEFVTRYDVPAIQFDDHFSLKSSFGYDDFTLSCYQQETGRTTRPAPADADWVRWRAMKLTQFVSRISKAIKAARPGIELSVSPNPYPWSYRNYVQDWPAWVEAGLVDEVVVQVYRNDLKRFEGELQSPVLAKLEGRARLAIGVMAGQKPAPVPVGMVRDQTAMAHEHGFGVVYFFQESLLRFTAPGETVESRFEALRLLAPGVSTRR